MARLLADENFEDDVVDELIALGHDAVTARAAGLSGTADPDVLAYATVDGRVVLTHDHDYYKLHKAGVAHAGIAYASSDANFAALAARIHAALAATPAPAGKLTRHGRAAQHPHARARRAQGRVGHPHAPEDGTA